MAAAPERLYPQRLYYVANAPVPSPRANAVQVARMCQAFSARGVAVELIAPLEAGGAMEVDAFRARYGFAPDFTLTGIRDLRMPGRNKLYALRLAAHLARRPPGLVYGRSILGCRVAAALGRPAVYEAHVPMAARPPADQKRFAHLARHSRLAGVVTISARLREWFVDAWPDLAERTLVAPDGADAGARPDSHERARGARPRIGYAGSLYTGKGMETIAALAERCPWADFVVAGGDADERAHWAEQCAACGNIEFVGQLEHAAVQAFLRGCDVLLAPYRERVSAHGDRIDIADWMSPLKTFEYMAAGRPLIASDLPVLREVLEDEGNAVLVPPADIDAWARAIADLLADPERAARIGARGRGDLEAHYTWDARAERILAWVAQGQGA